MIRRQPRWVIVALFLTLILSACTRQPTESAIAANIIRSSVFNPSSTYAVHITIDRGGDIFSMQNGQAVLELPRTGTGSGFFFDKSGLILTNYHVIKRAKHISVAWSDYSYDATIVGIDEFADLAVLSITPAANQTTGSFPVAPLGDSDTLTVLDPVVAIGFPANMSIENATPTKGFISNLNVERPQFSFYHYFIMANIQVYGGSSGGFLINAKGEIVGVTTLRLSEAAFGFFIPINSVKEILPRLRFGDVRRGIGNIMVMSLRLTRKDLLRQLRLKEYYRLSMPDAAIPFGVIVVKVAPKGTAEVAGIETSDVITHVNSEEVHDLVQFFSAIGSDPPGTTFTITYIRNDPMQPQTTSLTTVIRQ